MGKLTQWIDYLTIEPKKLTFDHVAFNYTHFTIDSETKALRRKMRLYKK